VEIPAFVGPGNVYLSAWAAALDPVPVPPPKKEPTPTTLWLWQTFRLTRGRERSDIIEKIE
jgi:hypothetical protein